MLNDSLAENRLYRGAPVSIYPPLDAFVPFPQQEAPQGQILRKAHEYLGAVTLHWPTEGED
jgi:hypothetical protein